MLADYDLIAGDDRVANTARLPLEGEIAMGLIIVAVIAAGLAGVLGAAARKPAVFTVERSTEVAASPQAIFPLIDDFKQWVRWSPWEKLDPGMKKSHSGSERGPQRPARPAREG